MATARANIALVLGQDEAAAAVVSTLVVRTFKAPRGGRLRFAGAGAFGQPVREHIAQVILPLVGRILEGLNVPRPGFEISVVNLGACSSRDIGLEVSGLSADAPLFLAMLGAALRIQLPEDMVTTGHIASLDGDIRPVRQLPAKLKAALDDPRIKTFIHPALDEDGSLRILSPVEKERVEAALIDARTELHTLAVADVAELMQAVFDDDAIVRAALEKGFFQSTQDAGGYGIMAGILAILSQNNDARFWNVLERRLFAGEGKSAGELLRARLRWQTQRKEYPPGLGRRLQMLVHSLPPAVRRLKIRFPLLRVQDCLRLGKLAAQAQSEADWHALLDAISGKVVHFSNVIHELAEDPVQKPRLDPSRLALEMVFSEMSEAALSQKIGIPLDMARLTFVTDAVVVSSREEFHDLVRGFFLHLVRRGGTLLADADPEASGPEALSLLERAFEREGGGDGAWAEARDGIHGGVRRVLDAMADQLKREQYEKCVQYVLTEALSPLEWDAKGAFMRAFLDFLAPHLPEDVRDRPPERYVRGAETLVRAYVQSMDRVKTLLGSL